MGGMSEQPQNLNGGLTFVYRFYDEADELLYVGITCNMENRFREHSGKEWFKKAVRSSPTPYRSRSAAFAAEATAILTEFPKYNTAIPTLARHDLLHERANQDPVSAMTILERVRAADGIQQKLVQAQHENEALAKEVVRTKKAVADAEEAAFGLRAELVKVSNAARQSMQLLNTVDGQLTQTRHELAAAKESLERLKSAPQPAAPPSAEREGWLSGLFRSRVAAQGAG